MPNEQKLLTVGHGATPQADFEDLLHAAGVESLVDVRIGPGSRKYPHFGRNHMEEWLPAAGIAYRWEQRLGGVLLDLQPVSHLMPGAKLVPHVPTAGVRVHRGHLQYDLRVDESVG